MDFVGAPNVEVLVPESDISEDPDSAVTLTGRVLDKNCNPIKNAKVQNWYAGGNPGEVFYQLIRKYVAKKFCYD